MIIVAGTGEADGTWLSGWSFLYNTTALIVLLVALLVISFVVITVLLLTRNKRGLDVLYNLKRGVPLCRKSAEPKREVGGAYEYLCRARSVHDVITSSG